MQKRLPERIFAFVLLLSIVAGAVQEDKVVSYSTEYNYIQPMSDPDINAFRPKEVRQRCRLNILNAYSLRSDAPSLSYKNPICPHMNGNNCCGPHDIRKIPQLWKANQKVMQIHNMTYLKMMRYLIGFSKFYARLAKQVMNQIDGHKLGAKLGRVESKEAKTEAIPLVADQKKRKECSAAAAEMLNIDYKNKVKAQIFYDNLNSRARFLQTLRQKFYCTLCAARPKRFGTHFKRYNEFMVRSTNRIKMPKNTCLKIVNHTSGVAIDVFNNYGSFLSYFMRMSRCIEIPDNKFEVFKQNKRFWHDDEFKEFAKDPFGLLKVKHRFNIFRRKDIPVNVKDCVNSLKKETDGGNCMKYCHQFSMVRPTPLFDGELDRVKEIYEYMRQFEHLLKDKNRNIFGDDIIVLKTEIERLYASHETIFFPVVNKRVNVREIRTRFVHSHTNDHHFNDPLVCGKDTTLTFKYKGVQLVSLVATALLAIKAF